jgi:hypothetical protein
MAPVSAARSDQGEPNPVDDTACNFHFCGFAGATRQLAEAVVQRLA